MKKNLLFGLILVIGLVFLTVWIRRPSPSHATTASIVSVLSESVSDRFKRATVPNDIIFPRDFGAHPDYQTEWWYYTGNLKGKDGREFGFQFTVFRRSLEPLKEDADSAESPSSAWRTQQIYFSHFTISDIANEKFYYDELYSRGSAELAGANAEPYHVWIENWQIKEVEGGKVRVSAETEKFALDLTLSQTLPPILHGQGGLSAKSLEEGNASYYYSQIQQKAVGSVRVGDEQIEVTGNVWKDHEYSTSVLSKGSVGWDWISLQFDNGGGLMLFQIRREDGTIELASGGTLIAPDGSTTPLKLADWELTMTDYWESPTTGANYPVGWELSLPNYGIALKGKARINNQELTLSSGAYWEGAVRFAGELQQKPLQAEGYIEMVGYADQKR